MVTCAYTLPLSKVRFDVVSKDLVSNQKTNEELRSRARMSKRISPQATDTAQSRTMYLSRANKIQSFERPGSRLSECYSFSKHQHHLFSPEFLLSTYFTRPRRPASNENRDAVYHRKPGTTTVVLREKTGVA